jgi:UDP-glucose:(heptosyl)LPS alpha-1,3-glucosyltransferase
MKLALCVFKYFPYGGLQRNFLAIAQELARRGHEVTIYTGVWEGERDTALDVRLLAVSGLTNVGKNTSFYRELLRALSADPVDLVVGFNKMPGLDVYYCADTCFATKAYEEKNWLYRLTSRSRCALDYEKAVFGSTESTEILLLSANEGEAFNKYYETPAKRMHLMPPGISKTRLRTAQSDVQADLIREEFGVTQEERLVVFLGSDYKRKGLDRALRAVAALDEKLKVKTRFLVVGQDKRQKSYEKLADNLGISDRVLFAGQRDDVPSLLFASDCLVHPAYLENTGNVLLEAVVAGLPVICSGVCGYAHYIEENNLGSVIPLPFSQQLMDSALLKILTTHVDWKQRCAEFANSADIYSRPLRAAECIEAIGEQR